MIQEYKNPIAKQFQMDFCSVIMKVLNNYEYIIKRLRNSSERVPSQIFPSHMLSLRART